MEIVIYVINHLAIYENKLYSKEINLTNHVNNNQSHVNQFIYDGQIG